LRAPFALGDRGELLALFESAGAKTPAVTTHRGTARFPSLRTMMEAELRGWLPVMGVVLEEAQIEQILADAEYALHEFVTADGRAEFEMPGHIVACTKEVTK
jgi:hypothetical protein